MNQEYDTLTAIAFSFLVVNDQNVDGALVRLLLYLLATDSRRESINKKRVSLEKAFFNKRNENVHLPLFEIAVFQLHLYVLYKNRLTI